MNKTFKVWDLDGKKKKRTKLNRLNVLFHTNAFLALTTKYVHQYSVGYT